MTLKATLLILLTAVALSAAAAQETPSVVSKGGSDRGVAKEKHMAPATASTPEFGNRYPRYQLRSGDVVELARVEDSSGNRVRQLSEQAGDFCSAA